MRLSRSRLLATSCLLLAVAGGNASSRPCYGGTVRVLLQYRVNTIDPLAEDDHPATRDRLASLTFETLTQIDSQGRVRARLATSWRADTARRVWQFRLRLANFHDGTPVTAADVVASLKISEPGWRYTAADRQTVTIETPSPVIHLPEVLALEKFAIIKRRPDGMLLGSGPYRLSQWQAGERAAFTADEDYWGGRSYPDAIEFQMGAGLRDQLLQRQLGPNAAAELYPDGIRALEQSGQEVLLSRPADLLVIVFLQPDNGSVSSRRKPVDPRLRQALSSAMDRAAISNAMLQKRGAPASGLLPQWLTGYEILLNVPFDREGAHKLAIDAALAPARPMAPVSSFVSLAYDFADPVAKLVAERIAFDASQAGLVVRPYGESHVNSKTAQASINADAVLLRLPLASLDPSVALAARAGDLGLDVDTVSAVLDSARPEDLLQAERKMLENYRIIPVAHVSQALWLNAGVHNWLVLANGFWDLDQLWVEGGR